MKINVIGIELKRKRWDLLWNILEQGKNSGLEFKAIDLEDSDKLVKDEECDGYIYVNINPMFTGKHFAYLTYEDTDADIIRKIQTFAKNIKDKKPVEKSEIKLTDSISLSDLCYEISEDEVNKLIFKKVVLEIEGKEVELKTSDIITLSKMYKVINEYGYKIKKVVM